MIKRITSLVLSMSLVLGSLGSYIYAIPEEVETLESSADYVNDGTSLTESESEEQAIEIYKTIDDDEILVDKWHYSSEENTYLDESGEELDIISKEEIKFSGKTPKSGPQEAVVTKSIPVKNILDRYEQKTGEILNRDEISLDFIHNESNFENNNFHFLTGYNNLVNGVKELIYVSNFSQNSFQNGEQVDGVIAIESTREGEDESNVNPRLYRGIDKSISNYEEIANFGFESVKNINKIIIKDKHKVSFIDKEDNISNGGIGTDGKLKFADGENIIKLDSESSSIRPGAIVGIEISENTIPTIIRKKRYKSEEEKEIPLNSDNYDYGDMTEDEILNEKTEIINSGENLYFKMPDTDVMIKLDKIELLDVEDIKMTLKNSWILRNSEEFEKPDNYFMVDTPEYRAMTHEKLKKLPPSVILDLKEPQIDEEDENYVNIPIYIEYDFLKDKSKDPYFPFDRPDSLNGIEARIDFDTEKFEFAQTPIKNYGDIFNSLVYWSGAADKEGNKNNNIGMAFLELRTKKKTGTNKEGLLINGRARIKGDPKDIGIEDLSKFELWNIRAFSDIEDMKWGVDYAVEARKVDIAMEKPKQLYKNISDPNIYFGLSEITKPYIPRIIKTLVARRYLWHLEYTDPNQLGIVIETWTEGEPVSGERINGGKALFKRTYLDTKENPLYVKEIKNKMSIASDTIIKANKYKTNGDLITVEDVISELKSLDDSPIKITSKVDEPGKILVVFDESENPEYLEKFGDPRYLKHQRTFAIEYIDNRAKLEEISFKNTSSKSAKDGELNNVGPHMEYKKKGTEEWLAIDSNNITGLEAGTYIVRYKPEDSTETPESIEVTIGSDKSKLTDIEKTKDSENIKSIDNKERSIEAYSVDKDGNKVDIKSLLNEIKAADGSEQTYEIGKEKTIDVIAEDGKTKAKYSIEFINREQKAPEDIDSESVSSKGKKDGKLKNLSTEMEYRKVNDKDWIEIKGQIVEGLEAGEYEVRYREKEGYNASKSVKIVIDTIVSNETRIEKEENSNNILNISNKDKNIVVYKVNESDKVLSLEDVISEIKSIDGSDQKYEIVEKEIEVIAEDGKTKAKYSIEFINREQKAPEDLVSKVASSEEAKDGEIHNVNSYMKYRKSGEEEWISIEGDKIVGLGIGNYEVKYAEREGYDESDITIITIGIYISDETDIKKKDNSLNIVEIDNQAKKISAYKFKEDKELSHEDLIEEIVSSDGSMQEYSIENNKVKVTAEDGETEALYEVEFINRNQEKPKNIKVKSISKKGAKDGEIHNVDSNMEYRKKGDEKWISIEENMIKGLEAGEYEIRYREKEGYNPSEAVVVTIKGVSEGSNDDKPN
ncbi:MAG: hypothetical protein Q4P31_07380, partial [Andreesenia angusta]|nr:hypothetical protein [Andreesenia angusta]